MSQLARPAELVDPGPRALMLMLTTACNFRCAYCSQHRGAPRTMPRGILDTAIRRLVSSRLDRPRLTLFGGEPLLAGPLVRHALERIRKWAPKRMSPDVRIVTNGTRLDEGMSRLLASRGVHITLSFDGVAPAQDDRSSGSFELLDHLLLRLRQKHPKHFRRRVAVSATLTSRNASHLSASLRYFLSRGVRDVDYVGVVPDDESWKAREARVLDGQLGEVVRLSLEEFRRSGEIPFRPFRGAAAAPEADGAPACACGSRGLLFVDVDGTLAPCSAFAPSTFKPESTTLRRAFAALGGLHISDPGLCASLIRREKRAGRFCFLAGPNERQGPRGACARCEVRSTCFVCPVAVACNGGRVPAFHCDVNRLFARHRAAFLRRTGRLREGPNVSLATR